VKKRSTRDWSIASAVREESDGCNKGHLTTVSLQTELTIMRAANYFVGHLDL
jgi:hypothetical protein